MLRQGILATLVLAIAPLAQAADNGIYLGAGYVQSDYGLDDPGIDVSRPRRLAISGVVAASASADRPVVVRLWTSDGRSLAIVPVVTAPPTRATIRD